MRLVLSCCACVMLAMALTACSNSEPPAADAPVRAALTVRLTVPERADWPLTVTANGNILPWQESVIGAELAQVPLVDVRAVVGQHVRKGEVLARLSDDTVLAEQAEARAAVVELEAAVAEARANAERARELRARGFYSSQLTSQYETTAHATAARLAAAQARLQAATLRVDKTRIRAPDDGVITAASASVGSLTQAGQELFRLIRGGRLEWRADVAAADLPRLRVGMMATVVGADGREVRGPIRQISPSVNAATRNGVVYVDLPVTAAEAGAALRAGSFARGRFELGRQPALSVPQSAVVMREGFAYVFRLGEGGRVIQSKVELGRREGDRVEVVAGVAVDAQVVADGAAFLADGDAVKVVTP